MFYILDMGKAPNSCLIVDTKDNSVEEHSLQDIASSGVKVYGLNKGRIVTLKDRILTIKSIVKNFTERELTKLGKTYIPKSLTCLQTNKGSSKEFSLKDVMTEDEIICILSTVGVVVFNKRDTASRIMFTLNDDYEVKRRVKFTLNTSVSFKECSRYLKAPDAWIDIADEYVLYKKY